MLTFEIHGAPEPQKQTRHGKGHCYDPSKKRKEQIQWQVKAFAPKEPLRGPISLSLHFVMPIPKSTSAVRKRHMINNTLMHVIRPDLDNLGYLVTNAMKGIIYADDSQIVELNQIKRYGDLPRTIVQIRELGDQICL